MGHIRSLWLYRGFVMGSAKREFQAKYTNSVLGALWTVLQPLSMIFVYTIIFSQLMRARLPSQSGPFAYSIYLCGGVLTWGLFSEITARAQSIFLEHANLLKKMSFPRICLPVLVVTTACINFGIAFGLFTVFLIFTGNFPGLSFFALLPLFVLHVGFAIGLGITLGTLNVFFRDVGQAFAVILQFWFWLTPIVYSPTILPEHLRSLLALNPLYEITISYQGILLSNTMPHWEKLLPVAVLTVLLLALGLQLFRRHSGAIVDEL